MGVSVENRLTVCNSGCVCQGQRVIILHKLFSLPLIYSVPVLSSDSMGSFSSSAGLSAHLFEACFLKQYKCALQQVKDHLICFQQFHIVP